MRQSYTHEDHGYHEKPGSSLHEQHKTNGGYTKQRSKWEFHELKLKPQKETLLPSRGIQRLVNRDVVFSNAKRLLGIEPGLLYNLIMGNKKKGLPGAGADRVRMVTAFIMDLWSKEYFNVDLRGQYDDSLEGSRKRARNALQGIIYGKKPIYLAYAGPEFFKLYPDLRELARTQGEAAAV